MKRKWLLLAFLLTFTLPAWNMARKLKITQNEKYTL